MLKYLYIDESGDLGIGGSEYLILSALLVENPAVLDRIIKHMRRNKFKKELKKAAEIKANKSSKELKVYMLQKLNEVIGAQIFYVVLEKKKLHSDFLKNNKHKLYNYVSGKLAKQILLDAVDVEVRIDKSKGKQLLQEDFNEYFSKSLREKSSIRKIIIYHSYSHSWSGLQFADLLSWSCFQKFEHNNNEYVDIIKLEQEVYHVW